MTAESQQSPSRTPRRRVWVAAIAWVVAPSVVCLGIAWGFGLGSSGAVVAALGLAVASPVLGGWLSCRRFFFETPRGFERSATRVSDWIRVFAPLLGLALAAAVLTAGSVSAGQWLVLTLSYWLLMVGGWGLAKGLSAVGLGPVVAVLLVGGTVAAGAFTPFYTDRMVNKHGAGERSELRGMLASFSPVLTLGAEVFDEQMLKKDLIYLHLKPGMSGMDVGRSPRWFGGWRLGAWFGIVVGVIAVVVRKRRVGGAGSVVTERSSENVESAGR